MQRTSEPSLAAREVTGKVQAKHLFRFCFGIRVADNYCRDGLGLGLGGTCNIVVILSSHFCHASGACTVYIMTYCCG